MAKKYNWGIIGAGNIAGKFALALNHVEAATLYAVASRDAGKAGEFATTHQAVKSYGSYEAVMNDPGVDIIYIATPHAFHLEQTIACLQHGKHVVCEKPMALTPRQVMQMMQAAKAANRFLMEGMWSRFMPAIQKVRSLIADGSIGEIRYLRADFGFAAPADPNNRLFNLALGGGSMLDVGIYPIFFTTLLLGEPALIKAEVQKNPGGADESCNVLLTYPGGASAQVFSSIVVQTGLTAEISGTKGRIELHNPFYKTQHLTVVDANRDKKEIHLPHELNGFEYEIRAVMEALDAGHTEHPDMPLSLTLQISRIMDQVLSQGGVSYPV